MRHHLPGPSTRHAAAVAVLAVSLCIGGPASAADWVIGAGDVDPPYGPERDIGASYGSLVSGWGSPTSPAEDIPVAVWPRGLEVTLTRAPSGSAVKFTVTRGSWRTPSGARLGMSAAQLRRIYGRQLSAVVDQRGLLGREHYMVRAGSTAVGFVMGRNGRVLWMVSGRTASVTADLRFAGPV